MDGMRYRLERWVLLAASRVEDPSRLRGLLHLAIAAETIADCAMEMVWMVEEGEEVHPVLSAAVSERSEEHTSELQSRQYLVCRLLLEKKNKARHYYDV